MLKLICWAKVSFLSSSLVSAVDSNDGGTSKMLIETHDGHRVEAVVIRRHGRATSICVSSQVGCQMGCQFCATGTMGIIGDLSAAEILEQIVHSKLAPSSLGALPLRNVVFMGMGEPLHNFRNVRAAVLGLTDPSRFGLGRSHVTISTVGVVPSIQKLSAELPGVPLALSLHAPNQQLREKLVPAARAWPLLELMAALDAHIAAAQANDSAKFTGVMIEYVLLAGVNDGAEHAAELAVLLAGKPVLVNLIPYNPNVTAEMYGFEPPTNEVAFGFGRVLIESGLRARVRIERGDDIAAACGQLAITQTATKLGGVSRARTSCTGFGGARSGDAAAVPDIEALLDSQGSTRRRVTPARAAGRNGPGAARRAKAKAKATCSLENATQELAAAPQRSLGDVGNSGGCAGLLWIAAAPLAIVFAHLAQTYSG